MQKVGRHHITLWIMNGITLKFMCVRVDEQILLRTHCIYSIWQTFSLIRFYLLSLPNMKILIFYPMQKLAADKLLGFGLGFSFSKTSWRSLSDECWLYWHADYGVGSPQGLERVCCKLVWVSVDDKKKGTPSEGSHCKKRKEKKAWPGAAKSKKLWLIRLSVSIKIIVQTAIIKFCLTQMITFVFFTDFSYDAFLDYNHMH